MAAVDGGTVLLLGRATLTPPAATLFIQSASVALAGEADTASSLTGSFGGFATLVGDALVSAMALAARRAVATISGDSTLDVTTGQPEYLLPSSDMEGQAVLAAAAEMAYTANAALAGDAAVAAAAQLVVDGVASAAGDAVLDVTPNPSVVFGAGASMVGDAVVTAAALGDNEGAADLIGGSAVTANMNVAYDDAVAITGGSNIVALAIVIPPLAEQVPIPESAKKVQDPYAGLQVERMSHNRAERLQISTSARRQTVDVDETAVGDKTRKVPSPERKQGS